MRISVVICAIILLVAGIGLEVSRNTLPSIIQEKVQKGVEGQVIWRSDSPQDVQGECDKL